MCSSLSPPYHLTCILRYVCRCKPSYLSSTTKLWPPIQGRRMFTPKSRNKRTRSRMAAAAKAVNARAAVASSAYIALGYCKVMVAIARGAVIPQNRIRNDLRRTEIQKFPGGACPQTPLACTLCARVCLPRTVLSSHSPAGPVRMSFHRPCNTRINWKLAACQYHWCTGTLYACVSTCGSSRHSIRVLILRSLLHAPYSHWDRANRYWSPTATDDRTSFTPA